MQTEPVTEVNYSDYIGKIIQVRKKEPFDNEADLVGRVLKEDSFFLTFGNNTYYYNGDTDEVVVSRIIVAEMGYKIHDDLVRPCHTLFKEKIDASSIKVLPED